MIKKFNVVKTRRLGKIDKWLALFFRKPKNQHIGDLVDIKNILVIDFALIGDMIMNIPFLRTIKKNCPNAAITMVCMPWAKIVLGDQNLVDSFIVFDGKNKLSTPQSWIKYQKEIRSTLKEINRTRYQIGIEPKGDLRHTMFLHFTNCERTISYNYTGGEYLITDSFKPKTETKHLIDEKIDLLEMSGFKIDEIDLKPTLHLSSKGINYVYEFYREQNLKRKRIIGIHPGASISVKQFRYYPDLISAIDDKLSDDDIFMVFEASGEETVVAAITQRLEQLNRQYIKVHKKLKEYIWLVSLCNIMICNDSAAAHLAAAYGVPVFVIFGSVYPETALPRGKAEVRFVSHDLDCKPCTLPECPLHTEACIKDITVEECVEKIADML